MNHEILERLKKVQYASRIFSVTDVSVINNVLNDLAAIAECETEFLLRENKRDLDLMNADDPKYDRLMLTAERIKNIAAEIRNVANLPYPVGKLVSEKQLPNGLQIRKVSVPLGVIGIIYESRPNVTFDVFSLCLKSGNACVLKGSKDAEFSNKAINSLIEKALIKNKLSTDIAYLMSIEREATTVMLQAVGLIDVLIPRGSMSLINYVRDNAKVPVIETGAGIVHTYIDKSADIEKAIRIVDNAKTRRVSVCNALDCLIVHESVLSKLERICSPLNQKKVELFADEKSYNVLKLFYDASLLHHANENSFGSEFLSMKMAIKTVSDIDEALEHIATFSSKHSEAIVAEDKSAIEKFTRCVDAAAVYVNASTAFTDGAQFGMGAEIGISTQKLHARGPMALDELTSYKYIIEGAGQIRNG
jgi:glutamate-5-semialdehyde dehydrogenase